MARNGAKSGKGSRSSKTARVLSLLTDPESAEDEIIGEKEDDTETSAARKQEAQRANDEATERQIHDALASELAGLTSELAGPASGQEPAPEPVAEAAPEPAPESETVAGAEPESAPSPVIPADEAAAAVAFVPEVFQEDTAEERPAGTPAPASVAAPAAEAAPEPAAEAASDPAAGDAAPRRVTIQTTAASPEQADDEEYTVLNVTQALVEEKAEKYIKMFGLCSCNRCHIDVIALSLSELPAKYVVVKGKDINPRLSFYESKYSSAVTTSVMSACKKVLEKPHHER